ncbi:MAG: sugar isomerase, partial [Spirochaetaceae bacterium]|nr:sugar isomerase [Spirochaetaceae bacterium]
SSFTSMALAGYSLGYLDRPGKFRDAVQGLVRIVGPLVYQVSDIAESLSKESFGRAFFIASPPCMGGALEAHLKVQELSGGAIMTSAVDCLGFRHGFMAAVDGSSLVVMCLSGDPRRRLYEMDLLRELRAKKLGKRTVVVADAATDELRALADAVIECGREDSVTDEHRAVIVAVIGQVLGLFFSIGLGLRPDSPSPSGIINRVVRGVAIHDGAPPEGS